MNCNFYIVQEDAPAIKHCSRCGFKVVSQHPPERIYRRCNYIGVGDYVALGLGVFGIKAKSGCGCNERQNWLNRLGAKLGL